MFHSKETVSSSNFSDPPTYTVGDALDHFFICTLNCSELQVPQPYFSPRRIFNSLDLRPLDCVTQHFRPNTIVTLVQQISGEENEPREDEGLPKRETVKDAEDDLVNQTNHDLPHGRVPA